MTSRVGFQYVVLRAVPRVDREEFLNVGVVLYCQDRDFLGCANRLQDDRLRAVHPDVDVAAVREGLAAVADVCADGQDGGGPSTSTLGQRFGWLAAPRSTVLQPGPIHGGVTDDPAGELERLLAAFVT